MQLKHESPSVRSRAAVRNRRRTPIVRRDSSPSASLRASAQAQRLSLRMTRGGRLFFCVILSAAKDLARASACPCRHSDELSQDSFSQADEPESEGAESNRASYSAMI